MSTMTKVFVVLTSVLSIAVSTLFIAASAQWTNWKDLAEQYATQRDAAVTNRMQTQLASEAALAMKDEALKEKEREIASLQDRIRDLNDEQATIKSDLARARSDLTAAQTSNATLQETLGVSTGEVKDLRKHNQELLADNLQLQTRNSRLNDRAQDLTAQVTIATDEVRSLQERLYAAEQRNQQAPAGGAAFTSDSVRPGPAVPNVAGPIRGEITNVDGRYASVSVGETSGVVPGMTFMIYRGNTYLGDLRIDRVRPKDAGGKLTLVVGDVQAGDPVVFEQ